MKKFRLTYHPIDGPGVAPKVEEVFADRWQVDDGLVTLYRNDEQGDMRVFDVPKNAIIRIVEMR